MLLATVSAAGCALRKIPAPTQEPDSPPTSVASAVLPLPNTRYENEDYGLLFETPPGFQHFDPAAFWDLPNGVLWSAGFSAPDDREALAYQAPVGVTVYANPDNLPLAEWFERHSGAPTSDPNTQIIFFDPMSGEVKELKGNPSLHYVRGRDPQREEMLFARPGIVVGVHYASGLAYDYQPAYAFILESLTFTGEPAIPAATP